MSYKVLGWTQRRVNAGGGGRRKSHCPGEREREKGRREKEGEKKIKQDIEDREEWAKS